MLCAEDRQLSGGTVSTWGLVRQQLRGPGETNSGGFGLRHAGCGETPQGFKQGRATGSGGQSVMSTGQCVGGGGFEEDRAGSGTWGLSYPSNDK